MSNNNNNNRNAGQKKKKTRRGKGQGPKQPKMFVSPQELQLALVDDDKRHVREHVVRDYVAEPAILAFVDPELSGGFRWSEPLTSSKTAVCTPQTIEPVGFASTDVQPANDPVDYKETFAISRRIPQCASIHFDHNTTGRAKQYDVLMQQELGASAPASSAVLSLAVVRPENIKVVCATANSGFAYQPHGPKLYAGTDSAGEKRFLWCDYDDTYSVTALTSNPATLTLRPFYYNPATNTTTEGTALASGALAAGASYTFPFGPISGWVGASGGLGGYFALQIESSAATAVTLSGVKIAGSGETLAHRAVGDLYLNDGFIQRIRMLGVSQMYSNRCALQYRQGKCAAAQIDDGSPWTNYMSYASVAAAANGAKMEADKGLYCFLKPFSDEEIELQSFTITRAGNLMDSFWPLRGFGAFVVTAISVNTATGREGEWTFDQAIEFTTTNKFVELRRPQMDFRLCEQAVNTVGGIQQFHENPMHMRDLVAAAKKAARSIGKGLVRHGPEVLEAAAKYGPQVIRIAQLLAAI